MQRFPNIHARCLQYGVDMTKEPIPVVSAAHYMCGGVVVDDEGRTTLPGLWAVGEVAAPGCMEQTGWRPTPCSKGSCTGTARPKLPALFDHPVPNAVFDGVPDWDPGEAVPSDEAVVVTQNWGRDPSLHVELCGHCFVPIAGCAVRLGGSPSSKTRFREYYWAHLVNRDMLELRTSPTGGISSSGALRPVKRVVVYITISTIRSPATIGRETRKS